MKIIYNEIKKKIDVCKADLVVESFDTEDEARKYINSLKVDIKEKQGIQNENEKE